MKETDEIQKQDFAERYNFWLSRATLNGEPKSTPV